MLSLWTWGEDIRYQHFVDGVDIFYAYLPEGQRKAKVLVDFWHWIKTDELPSYVTWILREREKETQ